MVSLLVILIIYILRKKKFTRLYAQKVVSHLIKELFRNIAPGENNEKFKYEATYTHKKYITMPEINDSKRYITAKDVYGKDYIEGQIGLTTFKFSKVSIEEWGTGDDAGRTAFKGVVLIADFHKDFSGSTYILRRRFFNKIDLFPTSIGAFKIGLTNNEFN